MCVFYIYVNLEKLYVYTNSKDFARPIGTVYYNNCILFLKHSIFRNNKSLTFFGLEGRFHQVVYLR